MTTSALPWRIEGCEIIDANDGRVAKLTALDVDNARRMVASCNRLRSFTIEELEDLGLDLCSVRYQKLIESIETATKQMRVCDYTLARETLLKALDTRRELW